MCIFCDIEPGRVVGIDEHEYKIMLGDKVCGTESMALDIIVTDDDIPSWYIVADRWANNERCIDEIKAPITYCPFCGRKLRND